MFLGGWVRSASLAQLFPEWTGQVVYRSWGVSFGVCGTETWKYIVCLPMASWGALSISDKRVALLTICGGPSTRTSAELGKMLDGK